jgi:hypothetical protein
MEKSDRIPDSMHSKFASITSKTDAFCQRYLNDEYRQLVRTAVAALCRKRPSPLLRGSEDFWAAGVIHAVGAANFVFDKSQTPHCNAPDIYSFFGVASSTGQGKSKQIRQWLKIHPFSFQWGLPSKFDSNPLIWMLTVNGMMVDVRHLPIEVQEVAYQKGLIPYVPGAKHSWWLIFKLWYWGLGRSAPGANWRLVTQLLGLPRLDEKAERAARWSVVIGSKPYENISEE